MAKQTDGQRMIREIVNELGLTHHEAARVFGVSYAALHSWMIGARRPSARSWHSIAEGLAAHSALAESLADRVRAHLARST